MNKCFVNVKLKCLLIYLIYACVVITIYSFFRDIKWENVDTALFASYYFNYFQKGIVDPI